VTTLFDERSKPVITGGLAERLPPRPYQRDALLEFIKRYEAGDRGFLCRLATGLGKTYTAALIADYWRSLGEEYRVLVIAYERTLVEQFRDEIAEFLPWEEIGLEMASDGWISRDADKQPGIVVASRQTLTGNGSNFARLDKLDPFGFRWLQVMDEAHGWAAKLRTCGPIVEHFEKGPASCRIGLTATPQRGDGVSLARLFGTPISEMRLSAAVADGYLVPFRQKYITVEGVDFKELKVVAGDFTDDELDRVLSEREAVMSMIGPLLEQVEGRRCLVFCPGVKNAKVVANAIGAEVSLRPTDSAWGGAEYMHGGTPADDRRSIIRRFQRDEFQFLCVCGLCRAGYNDPSLGAVACFRPTKSRVLAEQMKGRAVRTLRGLINGLHTAEERKAAVEASDKPDALVIDLVGVSGMPEVATTAELLYAGQDDELLKRMEAILRRGETESIDDAKAKAEAEIERETEERRRREREEAERQARLRVQVRYDVKETALDDWWGAAPRKVGTTDLASPGQVALLVALGIDRLAAERMGSKQAGAVISSLKAKGVQPRYSGPPPGRPGTAEEVNDWWNS
jgi:superfamily II DNA or RNA helicase